jgi:hypothetical protein
VFKPKFCHSKESEVSEPSVMCDYQNVQLPSQYNIGILRTLIASHSSDCNCADSKADGCIGCVQLENTNDMYLKSLKCNGCNC